jgi:hypothetical protein
MNQPWDDIIRELVANAPDPTSEQIEAAWILLNLGDSTR